MSTDNRGFTIAVTQRKFLSRQAHEMEALVIVTAAGLGRRPATTDRGPAAAEVVLVDCSGSMAYPQSKIEAARHATRAAIDALDDGVLFAVVEGRGDARVVYPRERRLVAASTATKAEAKAAVRHLTAAGGTAFGSWLSLADELLGAYPAAVRHAMLFTDGKNEWETGEQLDRVLGKITGRFTCDARGIGDQWDPTELRRIVSVLNGQAAGIVRFEDMATDFRSVMLGAMRKVVSDVNLRVRMYGNARLRYLKQVYPTRVDLTDQLTRPDEMTVQVATGAWADEVREFRLCVDVDCGDVAIGRDVLAARVELDVHRADPADLMPVHPGLVLVHWTDEPPLSSPIDPQEIVYDKQDRLEAAVTDGCAAYLRQQWTEALAHFDLAHRIARELRNTEILRQLSGFVEIVDEATGTLRLRLDATRSELLALDAASAVSSRVPDDHPEPPPAAGPPRDCAHCGRENDPDALKCEKCGRDLDDGDNPNGRMA